MVLDVHAGEPVQVVARRADEFVHAPMSRLCMRTIDAANPTSKINDMMSRQVAANPLGTGSP
jgi:hypothetical protein